MRLMHANAVSPAQSQRPKKVQACEHNCPVLMECSLKECFCSAQIDGSQDIKAVGSAIETVLDTLDQTNSLEEFQKELQTNAA